MVDLSRPTFVNSLSPPNPPRLFLPPYSVYDFVGYPKNSVGVDLNLTKVAAKWMSSRGHTLGALCLGPHGGPDARHSHRVSLWAPRAHPTPPPHVDTAPHFFPGSPWHLGLLSSEGPDSGDLMAVPLCEQRTGPTSEKVEPPSPTLSVFPTSALARVRPSDLVGDSREASSWLRSPSHHGRPPPSPASASLSFTLLVPRLPT